MNFRFRGFKQLTADKLEVQVRGKETGDRGAVGSDVPAVSWALTPSRTDSAPLPGGQPGQGRGRGAVRQAGPMAVTPSPLTLSLCNHFRDAFPWCPPHHHPPQLPPSLHSSPCFRRLRSDWPANWDPCTYLKMTFTASVLLTTNFLAGEFLHLTGNSL